MKKNLFFGLFATMVLLLTTGCQQDEVFVDGNATVTFKVSTPEMVTRGEQFSQGSLATNLQYWVYDANGNRLANLDGETEIHSATTVTIDLAAGKSYSVLFWASAEGAPYTINAEGKTMTVNYDGDCNDEKRDAFYKWYTFQVNDNKPQDVELLRPFAQLNIGTNDIAKAVDAGVNVTNTAVKVQGVKAQVYKTLNFADGTVEDAVNVEFTTFTRPDGYDFPVEGYEYLAMNYVLVPATKIVVDEVVLSFDDQTRTYTNIPLQRNHRTNIYGSLLTKGIGFNVEIDNRFDNEDDMTNVTVFSTQDLQAALNAAPANATTVITLGANIEANVTDIQKPGRKVVIEGNGNKYNGTIKVHSNSNYYDDAALTIKNVNFETSTASENFIEALENGSERYSSNITVENCTFTATDEAVNTAVGVQVKATRGVTVKNCTATNMHSLIQAQSCDTGDVKVIKSIVNGKNGVAFKQVKSATVEGTTITAAEYGIRFDGNIDKYGIVVKNNNVTAVQPFIVRKMTGKDNTITLEGQNTLTTEAEYQIVITNGSDDEAYVKPTGTYTLTGADNYLVYPRDYSFPVASLEDFEDALENPDVNEVTINSDLEYESTVAISIEKDLVIEGEGKTITAGGAASLTPSIATMGDHNVEINDANVVGGFVGAYYGANVSLNGGSLKFTDGMSGRNCFYAVGTNELTSIITIKDVDVNMANASGNSYLCAQGNAIIYVEGGKFYGKPVGSSNPYVKEVAYGDYTGQVIITGGTFNFDPSEWVAEGYKAVQSGSEWSVVAE